MTHPDLVTRLLRAVEDRVSRNEQRKVWSVNADRKQRVRLNESSEILGILRNVVKSYHSNAGDSK